MNDRFRFRVWNKHINEYCNIQNLFILPTGETGYFITDGSYPHQRKFMHQEDMIIEMSTGLKDNCGKLIYEGDIVEITIFGSIGPNGGYVDSDEIYKGTVVWDRDYFLVKTDTDTLLFPHSEDCTEIIGNIHEQAEQKD